MSGRAKIEAARDVAIWLDAQGEHKRANDIRSLCVSNAALIATASALRKEIDQLRTSAPEV